MPVGLEPAMLNLMHEIDRVFTKYPFFGSRQIAAYLPQSGFSAGRHRFRRLMNIIGLQATYIGPNTSKKHPQHRDLSLSAKKARNHAAQSGLVQRHHLHPRQKQLFVLSSDHGLGDPQGFDLAAFKYAGCQLLH